MKLNYSQYYFLGIGGIGMSAIARYFNSRGYRVGGYDRTETKLTKDLINEGIEVTYEDTKSTIPTDFLQAKQTLIIITPALPSNHQQLKFFVEKGYTIVKRAELLGMITEKSKGICVAGTHGKTTTSTMIAHLLYQSSVECSAFLGGISQNYKTNYLNSNSSNYVVIEADEYDRSFHHLKPYMAVITSVEPDHLDIYGNYQSVLDSFAHFASLIRPSGVLLINSKVKLDLNLAQGVKKYTYGIDEKADFYATNIRTFENKILFDFVAPTETIHDVRLNIPIKINVENSVSAMAMAWLNGAQKDEIRAGMSIFSGIYRRFNFVYQSEKVTFIDDYAHHPAELRAGISSLKELYPNKKITGIFQPHLYSRTLDFADEFAKALSQLDELILLDIYPAREKPIQGVTSEMLLEKVRIKEKIKTTKENVIKVLDNNTKLEVLVTFGAGDIETIVPKIKEYLKEKEEENGKKTV